MELSNFYNNRYINNLKIWSWPISNWQYFTLLDIKKESLETKNILEIWVWPNGLIFWLKETYRTNNYYWLDLSDNVLDYLNNNWFAWFKIDISTQKIPLEDNTIDIIIFNEVIEHLFDCQFALDEIYRVLKKWWKLFISTHNSFNIFMRIKFLLWIIPTPSLDVSHETMWEHIRLFNKNILKKLVFRAWFKKENLIDRSWFKFGIIRFYTWVFTSILSRHLYFIVKK